METNASEKTDVAPCDCAAAPTNDSTTIESVIFIMSTVTTATYEKKNAEPTMGEMR